MSLRMKSAATQAANSGSAETLTLEPGPRAGFSLVQLLVLMRPKQWSKNLLVFAAPLFTGGIQDISRFLPALIAFASLCLASSSIYVVNDLLDVERDRLHPKKSKRPIASGAVPVWMAIALIPVLIAGSIGLALSACLS